MTMTTSNENLNDLSKPRILMLHGGGVNGQIFRLQARVLVTALSPYFRLVFVDAPFTCPPHYTIVDVYGEMAPFRRWLRWLPEHPETTAAAACQAIQETLADAMEKDEGTGPWVGVLGFSQGSKIAASLLYTQQALREAVGRNASPWDFKFGVLIAGSAPPTNLDERVLAPPGIDTAENLGLAFEDWPAPPSDDQLERGEHLIRTPTLHIHGMRDPGLDKHRKLLDLYTEPGTAQLIEWDGDHRVPITKADVGVISKAIIKLAQKGGIEAV